MKTKSLVLLVAGLLGVSSAFAAIRVRVNFGSEDSSHSASYDEDSGILQGRKGKIRYRCELTKADIGTALSNGTSVICGGVQIFFQER